MTDRKFKKKEFSCREIQCLQYRGICKKIKKHFDTTIKTSMKCEKIIDIQKCYEKINFYRISHHHF